MFRENNRNLHVNWKASKSYLFILKINGQTIFHVYYFVLYLHLRLHQNISQKTHCSIKINQWMHLHVKIAQFLPCLFSKKWIEINMSQTVNKYKYLNSYLHAHFWEIKFPLIYRDNRLLIKKWFKMVNK